MVLIRRIGQLQTHQKGHNLARTLQRRPWHLKLTFAAGNEIRVCIKVIPLLSTQLFSKSFLRQSSKRLCYFLISELISCQTSIRCTYEGVSETGLQTRVNKECYYDLSCLPVVQACRGCDRGEDLRLLPSECPEPSFYLLLRNQAQGPYPEAESVVYPICNVVHLMKKKLFRPNNELWFADVWARLRQRHHGPPLHAATQGPGPGEQLKTLCNQDNRSIEPHRMAQQPQSQN
ncbi:hypothetical protein MJT46_009043 [Ovis ammon polii x Ovis aries]|nr:hypothetical protein MJT46_009043 [Ovis ammon polii x Ovis aries]